jgi:hypothetical protein
MPTTIQDYAKSKKIRVHQAKSVIKAVLGEVPETLSDEEVKRINQASTEAASEQALETGTLSLPSGVESTQITYQTPEKIRIKIQGILDDDLKIFYPSQTSFTAVALACYKEYNLRLANQTVTETIAEVSNILQSTEQAIFMPLIDNYIQKIDELKQREIASKQKREVNRNSYEIDRYRKKLEEVGVLIDTKS